MRRSFLSAALAAGTTIAWEETEWHDNRPHPDIHRPPTRGTTCTSNTLYTQTSWTNTVATTELPESPPGAIQSTVTEVVQETVDVTVTVTAEPHPSSSSCRTLRHNTASQSAHFGSPTPSCSIPQAPLTNEQQVGQSLWGTLCQPNFPKWLPDEHGRRYESAPWGNRSTKDMDGIVNDHVPVTNVTRKYDFTISRGLLSADGVERDVILVNNQFPGPAIEANFGDMIEITVHNNISFPLEGTALHWHGFLQRGTNWFDGVPGISQCPIAPGHSYTYTIHAQLYGSSWYHAHYSAQYTAGVTGPIIVYGPSQAAYDIDLGPVILSDWYHVPYFSVVTDAVGTDLSKIPISDSLLINGRGRFDCSRPSYGEETEWLASHVSANRTFTCVDGAGLSKFKFQRGKTHRLRLMNMGADGVQKFSIDGHKMNVIAYDYVPVTPHTVEIVTLAVGQRADVLVTADNTSGNMFWMRTRAPGGPVCGGSSMDETMAAIYYEDADTNAVPSSQASLPQVQDVSCDNLPLNTTQPEYTIAAPSLTDAFQQDMDIEVTRNATGNFEWRLNNQTFRANYNQPTLYLAAQGDTRYLDEPQWNMLDMGTNSTIVLNVTNKSPLAHPFHLHGHNFFVLNVGGRGTIWDGSIINPSNPMRRDTQMIPAGGYAAFAFNAKDNPGVWSFHCHAAWHLSGGLAINLITHANSLPAIPEGEYEKTCTDWNRYTSNNIVDQIDAGS